MMLNMQQTLTEEYDTLTCKYYIRNAVQYFCFIFNTAAGMSVYHHDLFVQYHSFVLNYDRLDVCKSCLT